MKAIPFFSDGIEIDVHTASDQKNVGRRVSLRAFADGAALALYRHGDELVCYRRHINTPGITKFIEGPEA